jgi:hypothetical protein
MHLFEAWILSTATSRGNGTLFVFGWQHENGARQFSIDHVIPNPILRLVRTRNLG